jgi:hypothetical protein
LQHASKGGADRELTEIPSLIQFKELQEVQTTNMFPSWGRAQCKRGEIKAVGLTPYAGIWGTGSIESLITSGVSCCRRGNNIPQSGFELANILHLLYCICIQLP